MRNRIPTLIFGLLFLLTAASLTACTRERPTPEPAATVEELPVDAVTSKSESSGPGAAAEPDVVELPTAEPNEGDEADGAEGDGEGTADTFQYIVEPGDTLLSISLEFETEVDTIKERNNLFDDTISVGQPLLIPYVEGVIAPGMPTPTPGPFSYTVQPGETLGDIAIRFGVEPLAIVEASNLLDQNTLSVGQKLIIPNYQPSPAEIQVGGGDVGSVDTGGGSAEDVTHVVQSGESLGVIADAYGVDANEIARVNNVSNWNLLRVGQELVIPGISRQQAAELRGQLHVVQSGESLSQIAAQYDKSVDEIIATNGIDDPNAIRVGMELIIPE